MIVNQNNFASIKNILEINNPEYSVLDYEFKEIKNRDKTRKRLYLKVLHKCCGLEFLTPAHKIKDNHLNCPKCVYKKKDNNTFVNEFNKTAKNEYQLLSEYKKVSEKIRVKHLVCGYEYEVTPNKWLAGRRCPKCFGPNKSTFDIFKKRFYLSADNEYELLSTEYINNFTKVKVKHLLCGYEYLVSPQKWLAGRRCPHCKQSKGEKLIEKYLKENNRIFKNQVRFSNCKDKNQLPFDFGVYDKNNKLLFLIEFDGYQHFQKRHDDPTGEKLAKVQAHDNIKTNFCKENNIPLLRIRDTKKIITSIEKMFNDYPERE